MVIDHNSQFVAARLALALFVAVAFVTSYATAVVMLTLASSEPMQIPAWSEGARP